MKRLKSSDDLSSNGGEKSVFKDWGRKDDDSSLHRSFSHRSSHYKSESGKKGSSSSSSRYERVEDDRKNSRSIRKRPDYDGEGYERRKSHDRYRDSSERAILSSSPRGGYGADRIHRSESFSGPRRDFPKGFRSERDRSRREGSVSSWRRFSGGKDVDEGTKSGGDSARAGKAASEEISNVRSPQGVRDAKSPPWSKDSGSEQSKSIERKKSESLPAQSGNNSEMEEGELQPDAQLGPIAEPTAGDQPLGLSNTNGELQYKNPVDSKPLEAGAKSMSREVIKSDQACILAEKANVAQPETLPSLVEEVKWSSDSQDSSTQKTVDNGVEVPLSDTARMNDAEHPQDRNHHAEGVTAASAGISTPVAAITRKGSDTGLEVKEENKHMHGPVAGIVEGHGQSGDFHQSLATKELTQNFKDKGKSVASAASVGADSLEGSLRIENEPRDFLISSRENDMQGPSTRGFDLFFTDPVKKSENVDQAEQGKPKDEKLSLEPLELSLRLPNVLLPIGSQNPVQSPDSPSQEMSIQSHASSFRTSSDGFTMSRSFSGSQNFSHNPSCSLTENSFDFEQSVGSRPLFQGVLWQVQSSDDHKNGEPSMHPKSISNGNGIFHQPQISHGIPNGSAVQIPNARVAEGGSKLPLGLERQLSTNNKQPSGSNSRHLNEIRSPSQSVGSRETGSEYQERKRVMRENMGTFSRSASRVEKEKMFTGAADLVESLLAMVVSDPIHVVARKLDEMPEQSVAWLKESVRDIISSPSKRWQFSALKKVLESRSDITLEMLQKGHRVQIQILVALKTGSQDFLQQNCKTSSSDLAEIFLNLRCRNPNCHSGSLPVDECDCKICAQKNGFCSACMCLVCSKFDTASNTCSWVGCDVCLHWCHTDCGLRESYIRNGRSAAGVQGQTEMQFHCVACDHPSEMFGFVREVFKQFAEGWTAETLANELEYVRRIFSASDDIRGKRLREISLQMLSRLSDKSDVHQVRSYIMSFFSDSDALKLGNNQIFEGNEISKRALGESSNHIPKTSQEPAFWMKSAYTEKPLQLKPVSSDPPRVGLSLPKEPVFDELDSIVRIKVAEAQMFQTRADEARREAEGLKRIAVAKNKKIDEEFSGRIAKLHLSEAEEARRRKYEELQGLENVHREYVGMKVRMEREIRDLLSKMEATKRNLGGS